MNILQFIHRLEHLSCFQFLAFVCKADTNLLIHVLFFCEYKHTFLLIYLGAELLDRREGVYLALVEMPNSFSKVFIPSDILVLLTYFSSKTKIQCL